MSSSRSPPGASASLTDGGSRGGQQEVEGGDAESASDHDELGIEDVDEGTDRDAEMMTDLVERGVLPCDELARRTVRAEDLACETVDGGPGAVRLDVPAPAAVAVTRLAVLDDHDVTELGPAAIERPVEHHAAAHARCPE